MGFESWKSFRLYQFDDRLPHKGRYKHEEASGTPHKPLHSPFSPSQRNTVPLIQLSPLKYPTYQNWKGLPHRRVVAQGFTDLVPK
jgi:hypothetical protein